jgi:integrase
MRKGELLRLNDVNFSSVSLTSVIKGEVWEILPAWLLIEKTKNGKPRTIPIQRVAAILRTLCDATTGEYIFTSAQTGSQFKDTKKAFVSACREAKIVNLTFHDLRHTWASRAADMGVPEHVRGDILGYSATSMTGDYTHASTEEMEGRWTSCLLHGQRFFSLGKISAKCRNSGGRAIRHCFVNS